MLCFGAATGEFFWETGSGFGLVIDWGGLIVVRVVVISVGGT